MRGEGRRQLCGEGLQDRWEKVEEREKEVWGLLKEKEKAKWRAKAVGE